jgi:hypothetical protein
MKRSPEQNSESDEVLVRFPELARTRTLFIELLKDRSPLVNLGYTNKQVEFAIPALRLLQEKGEVLTHLSVPYLSFQNPPDGPEIESLQVYELPSREGYYLFASRDETMRGWADLTLAERRKRLLFGRNPVIIFDDLPIQAAFISLFEDKADIKNLDYLIAEIYGDSSFTDAPMGMKADTPLTRAARRVGLAGTYEAAWVDERIKLEFVAKIEAPEDRTIGPNYVAYRKLRPVGDLKGTMIPFGKKANISEDKVNDVLSAQQDRVISGELALGRARI